MHLLMIKIAGYGDIHLYVPPSSHYSFFNSPYVGHRNATAVDVYSPEPILPVEEGRVRTIRKVHPPRCLEAEEEDYVVVVENGDVCLKVLHVRPSVKVGERLSLGDSLGRYIRSGFFRKWSDNHAHYELRKCDDPYRARGAYPLKPLIIRSVDVALTNEFVVTEKREHYYWLVPAKKGCKGMTPLGKASWWVEGGLPHYGYGAVFGDPNSRLFPGSKLQLRRVFENVFLFAANLRVLANGKEVTGIGLYCNNPRVKLIGGDFEEGDTVHLDFAANP